MASQLDSDDVPFGARLQHFRNRAGMSRRVLGELVGRSEQWVKALETGRQLAPRLPMLLRLAETLRVSDLAQLTGEPRLPSVGLVYWADDDVWRVPGVDAAERERALELTARDGRCWLHSPPGESIGLDWAGLTRLILVATEVRDRLLKR